MGIQGSKSKNGIYMKFLKYIQIFLLGGFCFLYSCDSMEDTYKEYIEGGEIVYRAKAKDVIGDPGYFRTKLHWSLYFPTQVVSCEIWEETKKLATIPVTYRDTINMEYILDNLEERTYTFFIYSLDAENNRSVKSDVVVDIYGLRYESTLRTERSIESVLRKADASSICLVELSPATSSKLVKTSLTYQTNSGETKTMYLERDQISVLLEDVNPISDFTLQDFWLPEKTAIDTVASPAKEYKNGALPNKSLRKINNAYKLNANTVSFSLSAATSNTLYTLFSYGDKEVLVEPSQTEIILTDVPIDATIKYITVVTNGEDQKVEYLTPEQSLETATLMLKIAMADWGVTEFSSQQESGEGGGGGHASHAIDGDFSTYWHTQYSPNQPGYPHYMVVDLKSIHTPKMIAVARRNANSNFPSKMKVEVSLDGIIWNLAGDFTPDNTINGSQLFILENPVEGQYVKVTAIASATSNSYMCLSELSLYE